MVMKEGYKERGISDRGIRIGLAFRLSGHYDITYAHETLYIARATTCTYRIAKCARNNGLISTYNWGRT